MLASQGEIKNKIDQLKLGYDGYSRQLTRPTLDAGRRERLEIDVHLLSEEIATLEKLLQLGRAVDDRARIEEIARERLAEVRRALAQDDALSNLNEQEREYVSGEISALVWALGEDALTLGMAEMMRGRGQADPGKVGHVGPPLQSVS